MRTSDFDYDLPEELIAQTPLKNRSASRLLVLDRKSKTFENKVFTDIIDYLNEGDALVINETKVLPARLIGVKESTLARIELLLLKNIEGDVWNALSKPQKRLKKGTIISFGDGLLKAEVLEILDEGMVNVKLVYKGILNEVLDSLGEMPLPPYIHEKLKEKNRYQTVYAKNIGSSAAPTAGLHFTDDLLKKIENKGVKIVRLTLHVGLGTFRPVSSLNIEEHKMHSEYYELSEEASIALRKIKASGGKIIAVGTTCVRTLESIYEKYGEFRACSGNTSIFIYPGFKFKAVDEIITNFHLPKSTLIMLVSAFAGTDYILDAYKYAVSEKYRFFSFGDAMLIK